MRTAINWEGLQAQLPNLNNHASQIDHLLQELQSVSHGLKSKNSLAPSISVRLQQTSKQVETCCSSLIQIRNTVEKISFEYCTCELQIANQEVVQKTEPSTNGTQIDGKTFAKLAGSFGLAGKMVDSMYGISTGGTSCWESIVKLVETGAKTAQRMADGKIVDIFGTLAVGENPLSKELAKYVYDPSKCSTVAAKNASKIAVSAKWVSLAFSGLLNLKDNFEEFDGNWSNERMYTETVVETAIDVGKGIAFGSLGALAVGSAAPVWAAAITTVGIASVCEFAVDLIDFTFKTDVKEVVSDFVVDSYEFIRDHTKVVVNEAQKYIGKAVSKTANCVSAVWKNIKSWF